jgi:hypothetical protein
MAVVEGMEGSMWMMRRENGFYERNDKIQSSTKEKFCVKRMKVVERNICSNVDYF